MNDLEDLVREELLARAEAADAEHPADPADPAAPRLAGLERRIRVARLRRRWTAATLTAVAVAAALVLPITLVSPGDTTAPPVRQGGHGPVPLSDPSVTPPGWAPVADRRAQISVPANWRVSPRLVCGRGAPGFVVLGTVSTTLRARPACRQAANMAAIVPVPAATATGIQPTGVINGIGVRRVASAAGSVSYLVPPLNVQVTVRGPLASRVLATLTRSPRAVALERGRPFPVPDGWRWHDFGGIRFATPPWWQLTRDDTWWGGCGFGIQGNAVILSTATRFVALRCPLLIPEAGVPAARQGIVVGTGRLARTDLQYVQPRTQPTRCLRLHGMLACALAPDFTGNATLTLAVHRPGGRHSITVEIGLAGTGATARTILDSIRPG